MTVPTGTPARGAQINPFKYVQCLECKTGRCHGTTTWDPPQLSGLQIDGPRLSDCAACMENEVIVLVGMDFPRVYGQGEESHHQESGYEERKI